MLERRFHLRKWRQRPFIFSSEHFSTSLALASRLTFVLSYFIQHCALASARSIGVTSLFSAWTGGAAAGLGAGVAVAAAGPGVAAAAGISLTGLLAQPASARPRTARQARRIGVIIRRLRGIDRQFGQKPPARPVGGTPAEDR